jgi:hypothetical protein
MKLFNGRAFVAGVTDGGVFAFGDAHFYGSEGAKTLSHMAIGPIVAPVGNGYTIINSFGAPTVVPSV